MAESFSIASAHLKFYVNGKLLGYVVSVPNWNIQRSWGELREIDNLLAKQLAPRLFACSGSVVILRGRHTGGLEGAGLVASGQAMLLQRYLTFEIQDRVSQDIVFRGLFGQVDNESWKIDQKGLVTGTFNFKCLAFANEATQ